MTMNPSLCHPPLTLALSPRGGRGDFEEAVRATSQRTPSPPEGGRGLGRRGSNDDPFRRNQARPLRDPLRHRRGRDGGGLQGARHAARPRRRRQGASRTSGDERGDPPAVRARGEDDLAVLAPAHLRAVRRRARGRRRVPRHGVPRGRVAGRSPGQGPAADRADPALRDRDRRRARQGAPAGDRPSRPEARQHHDHEVGREAARLRPGEAPRDRRRAARLRRVGDGDRGSGQPAPDRARHDPRHLPVHGARAARGRRGRFAVGHLRLRRRALRDGDGSEGVHGQEPGVADRVDPPRRSRARVRGGADGAAGVQPRHQDLPREGPGASVPDGA